MNEERPPREEDATSVTQPKGGPPDEGLAYDPEAVDVHKAWLENASGVGYVLRADA